MHIFFFRIVAIQFLHKSETVKKMQTNTLRMEQHKAMNSDIKPNIKLEDTLLNEDSIHDGGASSDEEDEKNISQQNLQLADNLNLVRVTEKNPISLRHMARRNFILDVVKEHLVFEEKTDLYKVL